MVWINTKINSVLVHDKNVFHWLSENWFCPKTLKGVQFSSTPPFRDGVKNRGKSIFLIFCRVPRNSVLKIFKASKTLHQNSVFYYQQPQRPHSLIIVASDECRQNDVSR